MSAFDPATIDWRHPWIPIDDPAAEIFNTLEDFFKNRMLPDAESI